MIQRIIRKVQTLLEKQDLTKQDVKEELADLVEDMSTEEVIPILYSASVLKTIIETLKDLPEVKDAAALVADWKQPPTFRNAKFKGNDGKILFKYAEASQEYAEVINEIKSIKKAFDTGEVGDIWQQRDLYNRFKWLQSYKKDMEKKMVIEHRLYENMKLRGGHTEHGGGDVEPDEELGINERLTDSQMHEDGEELHPRFIPHSYAKSSLTVTIQSKPKKPKK